MNTVKLDRRTSAWPAILASLAWNPGSLIAFRILQAIGGGFLSATSMAVWS